MIILPLLLAVALPFASALPLDPNEQPLRGPSVVVLWASWCASCRAEMDRLPRLSSSAAPLPIHPLALDPPERARALLQQRHQPIAGAYADPRDPRTVLNEWGGRAAALPLAVALDRQGRVCGRKMGLLGADQLHEWAVRCSR